MFIDIKNTNRAFFYKCNFQDLYPLLNKQSIKQFAFILIKPLLKRDWHLLNFCENNQITTSEEVMLLKKYMQKFNQNYYRYFFYQHENYEKLPTKKEINTHAIETLFLLAGI